MSPVINLSDVSSPAIGVDTYYVGDSGQTGDVDLSLDGGTTWTTLWQQTTNTVKGFVDIPIPQAAGQSDVQVRFHFTGTQGGWWSLDNVAIGGNAGCNPLPGGMLAGVVKDGNTGQPVNGVQVASVSAPSYYGVAAASPGDPHLPSGFYEFFFSLVGRQKFAAADTRYQSQTKIVKVAANTVTKEDFTLQAGHLAVASSLSGTVKMGGSATRQLTISNTGKMPAQLTIGEQTGSFTSLTMNAVRPQAGSSSTSWAQIPDYASDPGIYNVVGYDDANGKVYSAGGGAASVRTASAYDPQTQEWSPIAAMPVAVTGATAQFLNGKFYVFGGATTGLFQAPVDEYGLQIYNPTTNKWKVQSGGPTGSFAFAASATLGGQLYVVGGCPKIGNFYGFRFPITSEMCDGSASDSASRYDPATGQWTSIAGYPLSASNLACGGVAGELVCTGGLDDRANRINPKQWIADTATYIYNPATNTWSPGASLPIGLWGMTYGAANGQLLVSDGITKNSTKGTTRGFAFQPGSNTWKALPASPGFRFMGGSACGFFQIAGVGQSLGLAPPEELSGYDQCGDDGTQVPWLSSSPSQVTVSAGGSVTVTVTLDGGAAGVTQPGSYTAGLTLINDTPYATPVVGVTMTVTPPKTWGQITGTVSGTACGGTTSPLSAATVQIDNWAGDDTLTTDTSGQYSLWLDKRSNPLTLLVTKNGWRSQSRTVKITAGQTTTANFTLTSQACS